MAIKLTSVDTNHKGEKWLLDVNEETAVLTMPNGHVALRLTSDEAHDQLELPSFSTGNQHVIVTSADNIWTFAAWPKDVKRLKAFVYRAEAATSTDARGSTKRRAIIQSIIGAGVCLGGVALTADSFFKAADNSGGGEYIVFFGAILTGLIILGKGFSAFGEHGRMKQHAARAVSLEAEQAA